MNRMFKLVLTSVQFFGLVLPTACDSRSESDSGTKIVGGSLVSETNLLTTFTVALLSPSGAAFCTGSLITPTRVVTAAHCLEDYDEDYLFIFFGTNIENVSEANVRAARSFKVNPAYNPSLMITNPTAAPGDIALVDLHEAAPEGFAGVDLLDGDLVVGEELTLAGFGLEQWFLRDTGILRSVTTNLISSSLVAKEIQFGGNPGRSACMGDSGGPALVVRDNLFKLVGVTSRGSAVCSGEGIYTDIRYYLEFLE